MGTGRRAGGGIGGVLQSSVILALLLSGGSPYGGTPQARAAASSGSSSRFAAQATEGLLGHRTPLSTRSPRHPATTLARLKLHPNIETAGVVLSGPGLPQAAQLYYRPRGESAWQVGHPLVRLDDGRLVGSLFGLSPSTTYEVRVPAGGEDVYGSFHTQADELEFLPTTIIHVDDNAPPGGDGSALAPFQTIQQGVNHASPGTQVLVDDGIYHETVVIPASGLPGQWIQVKAAGGGAILDGAHELKGGIWSRHPTNPKVWFTRLLSPIRYLARDGLRYYLYDDRSSLMQGRGHNRVPIDEGWYYESSTRRLYVRSASNPANHTWQAPLANQAFHVDGRDWIWIEGFEMRFYGAGSSGCGVCTVNASHLVVRRNRIHNVHLGIFVNWTGGDDRGNDTRIEYNDIFDPAAADWAWRAVKGTSMEGTGIIVRGHIGAIVRGNQIHDYFNGIFTGSSAQMGYAEIAFDADIYQNYIHDIRDDGLEPEGACVNHRFRNNTVDRTLVGISLAPVTKGPTWVLRSTFTNYTGSGVKWDRDPKGAVFFYHNTVWTNVDDAPGMRMISSVHNTVLRNNIIQSNDYAFEAVPMGSTGNDWDHNNWHTMLGPTRPHFKWENVDYATIAALCIATGLECSGYEDAPGFANPTAGDFRLLPASPNLDRGVVIPGINDIFHGSGPDAGAFEHVPGSLP